MSVLASVFRNVCVTKQCILPKNCLKKQTGNRLRVIEWSRDRWRPASETEISKILLNDPDNQSDSSLFLPSPTLSICISPQLSSSLFSKNLLSRLISRNLV